MISSTAWPLTERVADFSLATGSLQQKVDRVLAPELSVLEFLGTHLDPPRSTRNLNFYIPHPRTLYGLSYVWQTGAAEPPTQQRSFFSYIEQ